MKLGGFVGEVEYRGELRQFAPLLKLGERFNVGKGTGFGLARYKAERLSSAGMPGIECDGIR